MFLWHTALLSSPHFVLLASKDTSVMTDIASVKKPPIGLDDFKINESSIFPNSSAVTSTSTLKDYITMADQATTKCRHSPLVALPLELRSIIADYVSLVQSNPFVMFYLTICLLD